MRTKMKKAKGRAFSGKFVVRLDPGEHEALARRAFATGVSLNDEVREAVRRHLRRVSS